MLSRYDAHNLLEAVVDGADVSTYGCDLACNRVGQILPNGVPTAAIFDALNRVETMIEH